jgi:hypothetical protein
VDDARKAEAIMSPGLTGRDVTRVLLDFAVTLQFWSLDHPTVELKLQTPFDVVSGDGSRLTINPERPADAARQVTELHMGVVAQVGILPGDELRLSFADGRAIVAPPDSRYESWSYASDDGWLVVCLPGGGLAIWTPPGRPS